MAGIYRLNIEQQLAEIGVRITPAGLKITRPQMNMKITSESPHMEIERNNPTFKVNRRKINSESGLKPPLELSHEYRDRGRAGAFRGIKTAVEDGNFLGDHKIKGDKVGLLAQKKTMSAILKKRQYNIGLIPKTRPEIEWEKGSMKINWSKHSLVIDWDGDYMPQLTVDPKYSIEVFLRKEPYFRVTVEEVLDPDRAGRFVDEAI